MAPKSKTPGCLERSISAFQAMYPNPDPPDDRDEVFRALRAHPGVEAEWEKIAPPRDDGLVDAIPIDVLGMILECKYFARENRDAPDDLARRRNDYRALRNAANLLHEHYEKMPIFSSPAKRQVMIRREAGTVAVEFDTRGMGDEIAERNIHEKTAAIESQGSIELDEAGHRKERDIRSPAQREHIFDESEAERRGRGFCHNDVGPSEAASCKAMR